MYLYVVRIFLSNRIFKRKFSSELLVIAELWVSNIFSFISPFIALMIIKLGLRAWMKRILFHKTFYLGSDCVNGRQFTFHWSRELRKDLNIDAIECNQTLWTIASFDGFILRFYTQNKNYYGLEKELSSLHFVRL